MLIKDTSTPGSEIANTAMKNLVEGICIGGLPAREAITDL